MFVDLNSDLGESFGSWKMGNDDQILPVVTSANIACGFHAGDPLGILKTVRKAVELGVTIGAHVSYPDLVALVAVIWICRVTSLLPMCFTKFLRSMVWLK